MRAARSTRPTRADPPAWQAADRERLLTGLAATGLAGCLADVDRLDRYAALLTKWNRAFNLLGATTTDDLIDLHLIDALAVLPALDRWLPATPVDLFDIGSGAGLPGIPIAIARPDWTLTLVEPVSKKAAFLRQSIGELRLANASVIEDHVERLPPPAHPPRHFICRAFTALDRFFALCQPKASAGSLFFAMKSARVHDEIRLLPPSAEVLALEPLPVPRSDLDRSLVVMTTGAATPH